MTLPLIYQELWGFLTISVSIYVTSSTICQFLIPFSPSSLLYQNLSPTLFRVNTSIWELDLFDLSPSLKMYPSLPLASCVLCTQQKTSPWPWKYLKTFSHSLFHFTDKISKTFLAISSTNVPCQIMVLILLVSTSMLCLEWHAASHIFKVYLIWNLLFETFP